MKLFKAFFLAIFATSAAHAEDWQNLVYVEGAQQLEHEIDFFQGSVRRSPEVDEARPIVRVKVGKNRCAGFFVKNNLNKFIVASARHCAKFEFESACANGAIEVATAVGNYQGRCSKIIASSPIADMLMFEAVFSNPELVYRDTTPLALSAQVPSTGQKVKVIGYPSDQMRKSNLTVSDNCQINNPNPIVWSDLSPAEQESVRAFYNQKPRNSSEVRAAQQIKTVFGAAMNCPVYGGNSGGPVMMAGKNIAIGMPSKYWPNIMREFPASKTTSVETTASFVHLHVAAVRNYGIILH